VFYRAQHGGMPGPPRRVYRVLSREPGAVTVKVAATVGSHTEVACYRVSALPGGRYRVVQDGSRLVYELGPSVDGCHCHGLHPPPGFKCLHESLVASLMQRGLLGGS
jgi:hypothetical protein